MKENITTESSSAIDGISSLEKFVLCQDCLKLKPYTDTRHDGEEQCECGGDFCGCPYCQETIEGLLAGETKAEILGTNHDVHGWTPEGVKK